VFPRADGGEWSESDRRNWRRRIFQPACERAGLGAHVRPYDLRHSFVSLLIHEGRSVVDVARQAGHSPQTCLSTYAHVLDEFDPSERVPAEQAIRAAREARVPDVFPKASG
jgi:integrase